MFAQQCCWQFRSSGLWCCVTEQLFSDILACLTLNTKALQSFKMLETTGPTTCHITDNLNPCRAVESLCNIQIWGFHGIALFWVMTPCTLEGKHQHFDGKYCSHLQKPEDREITLLQWWYLPNRMHGIIMQKTRILTKFYSLSEKSPGYNTQVKYVPNIQGHFVVMPLNASSCLNMTFKNVNIIVFFNSSRKIEITEWKYM